jgi:protein-disulfide isomerase
MLTGNSAVAAAGFLTARCAPRDKYFQVVDELFDAQPRMDRDGDDMPSLLDAAAHAGLSNAQVSACLGDHAALAALEARADSWVREDHVSGTPEFDVAGRRFSGETSLADLAAAIDAAHHRPR